MPSLLRLEGQRFDRLVALSYLGKRMWLCRCDCGTEKAVHRGALRNGLTRSCGCLNSENVAARNTSHGLSHTRTYRIWLGMVSRCRTPSSTSFKYYGALGVTVCEAWAGSFVQFVKDMGMCVDDSFSIERLSPFGNYEPGNCIWLPLIEQNRNKR